MKLMQLTSHRQLARLATLLCVLAILGALNGRVTAEEAPSPEPCYLRITNQMVLPVTVLLEGKDVMHPKARQRAVEANVYSLHDKGEIFQSAIRDPADKAPLPKPIAPTQASEWLEITPFLVDPTQVASWKKEAKVMVVNEGFRAFHLRVLSRGHALPKLVRFKLELARSPKEPPYFVRGIERDSPLVVLIVPKAGYRQKAFLDEDGARLVLDYLKGLNLPGKLPEKFYPHFSKFMTKGIASPVRQLENEIVRQMGDNPSYHSLFLYFPSGVKANRMEQEKALSKLDQFWAARQKELDVDVPSVVAAGESLGIALSGEFHLNEADNEFLRSDPEEQRRFGEYLKGQGFQPKELGWQSWEEARMQYRGDSGELNPVRYWHSMQFRAKRVGEFFAETTRALEKLTLTLPGAQPDKVWIGPYHSEGHILVQRGYGIFMQGSDWWSIERARQGNMIRTEDQGLSDKVELSPTQTIAQCLDVLWSVAKRRGETMAFDVTVQEGAVPAELRWRLYAALGRGVRVIDHEYPGPPYSQFTYSVQNHPAWVKELARTYRRIATAEELLSEARQPDAPVAILKSQSSELWAGWPDTPKQMEDQFIIESQLLYHALRHNGIPVEFVDEGIVLDDGLKAYKVLYLCGKNLRKACAVKVRDWVRNGGTLYSDCASGLLDEYNRPNAALLEVYGLKNATLAGKARGGFTRALLATAKQQSTVTMKGSALTFPAWEITARLEPAEGADVLATFEDGSPAMLRSGYGKGTSLVTGAMPALEYGRDARDKKTQFGNLIPLDDAARKLLEEYPFYFQDDPTTYAASSIVTGFSKPVRDLICLPFTWAGITPRLQLSHEVVDGVLMTAKKGLVVTLTNYLVEPIPDFRVSVALEPGQEVQSVWSTELLKEVPFVQKDRRLTIKLRLDLADMLAIRFKE